MLKSCNVRGLQNFESDHATNPLNTRARFPMAPPLAQSPSTEELRWKHFLQLEAQDHRMAATGPALENQ